MKQIIALAIFVCASYGVQAQGQCKAPAPVKTPPAPKAANTETRTGQVAPMPEARTGQLAPMPTLTPITSRRKKG